MPFNSFLGNSEAVAILRGLITSGRVPGAMVFAGPDGVGKRTLAEMMAKALNCERLKGDFCGECSRCLKCEQMLATCREEVERRRGIKDASRRSEGLIYFDLQLIAPLTRYILTEQVRQMRQTAYTRPFELPRRIFIIDQAQALHWQAVDLLLKVLEEPPDSTLFILICPNLHELRSTIRSRCFKVTFKPVEQDVIRSVLGKERGFTKADLELAVRIAAGSVAQAKNLDLAAYRQLREPWVNLMGTLARKELDSLAPQDWKRLFDSARALAESRDQFEEVLGIGYGLLHDLLELAESDSTDRLVNLDLLPQLRPWSSDVGLPGLRLLKDGLDEAFKLQVRNVNQQLGFEAMAVGMMEGRTGR
ncbi:MAG: ATP-binding protein [Terriglobia bacterium]